uniref:Uncharacterized protein n=1 Tax=Caenorhabditis japonica TaxID=281687 RepID=A0A8R1EJ11_CAEJA
MFKKRFSCVALYHLRLYDHLTLSSTPSQFTTQSLFVPLLVCLFFSLTLFQSNCNVFEFRPLCDFLYENSWKPPRKKK